jgi:hypothetical protein
MFSDFPDFLAGHIVCRNHDSDRPLGFDSGGLFLRMATIPVLDPKWLYGPLTAPEGHCRVCGPAVGFLPGSSYQCQQYAQLKQQNITRMHMLEWQSFCPNSTSLVRREHASCTQTVSISVTSLHLRVALFMSLVRTGAASKPRNRTVHAVWGCTKAEVP